MVRAHILFDLDGTLVDSFEGIATSIRAALASCGVVPQVQMDRHLVGPPLRDVLMACVPGADNELVNRLTVAFREHYDSVGCRLSVPFPGVDTLLRELAGRATAASVVTNKRAVPSRAIVEALGWTRNFEAIYAPDSYTPHVASKAELLARALAGLRLTAADACYVGDRVDDGLAADAAGLAFGLARWGYGDGADVPPGAHWRELHDPMGVMSL